MAASIYIFSILNKITSTREARAKKLKVEMVTGMTKRTNRMMRKTTTMTKLMR